MKINIEIDCSPAEARAFLGLPDVGSIQDAITEDLQERLQAALKSTDPEALLKAWLPAAFQGGMKDWEDFQRQFWSQMSSVALGGKGKDKDKG